MNEVAGKSCLRLAVLISGGGTTLLNLIRRIESGELRARIQLVVSSKPTAGGLRYAEQAQIPSLIVQRSQFTSAKDFSDAVFQPCRDAQVDLVVMGGFLQHVLIPSDFEQRVLNIHPALIPAFCGKGFYGQRVHEAVLEYGAKISGCTIHFVDNEYDHGPILLQRVVAVHQDDTPTSLAKRVFNVECDAYPEAIQLIGDGRVEVVGRSVRVNEVSKD